MAPSNKLPLLGVPEARRSSKSSSVVYTIIFILGTIAWFTARSKLRSYERAIESVRPAAWARRSAAAVATEDDGSLASSGASSSDGGGSSSAGSNGNGEDGEEGSGSASSADDPSAPPPTIDAAALERQRATDELLMLSHAMAARAKEEALYAELMATRNMASDTNSKFAASGKPEDFVPTPEDEAYAQKFARELKILEERWEKETSDLVSISPNAASDVITDSMRQMAEWHARWERRELDALLSEAQTRIGHVTLTGKKLKRSEMQQKSPDASTGSSSASQQQQQQSSSSSQSSNEGESSKSDGEGQQQTQAATASATDASSSDAFGVDAEVPLRIVSSFSTSATPLSESDREELLGTLRALETNAMQWTDTSKKQVVVLGERVYIGRDLKVYKWAFESRGFTVRMGSSSTGRMSTKLLSAGDWSVLLCLALNTEHCFTSTNLDRTKRYQRVNRVQGLRRVLWSKDSFCETVSASARGHVAFQNYIFDCWIFPREYAAAAAHAQRNPKMQFIVKPLSMGGGMGISVVDGERGLYRVRRQTHIVQNYLHNPMLIRGKKWDFRTYVLVTSVMPLRAYVYNRGLVRFASQAYDPNAKRGGKKTQFLTNTSVNKHYVRKGNVTDITWAFDDLRRYLDHEKPKTFDKLLARMQAAIGIVMLSAERSWKHYFDEMGGEMCNNCYQLMGVDLIVDDTLQPRVIEVNGQPSMQLTKSEVDHYTTTKKNMIRDLVALVYNEDRVASTLVAQMAPFDREVVAQLQSRDHEYLLEYWREKQLLGGFLPVYPSHRHHRLHEEFLKVQKSPPTDEARLMLHAVVGVLEQNIADSGGPKPRVAATQSHGFEDDLEVGDEPIVEEEEEAGGGGDDEDDAR